MNDFVTIKEEQADMGQGEFTKHVVTHHGKPVGYYYHEPFVDMWFPHVEGAWFPSDLAFNDQDQVEGFMHGYCTKIDIDNDAFKDYPDYPKQNRTVTVTQDHIDQSSALADLDPICRAIELTWKGVKEAWHNEECTYIGVQYENGKIEQYKFTEEMDYYIGGWLFKDNAKPREFTLEAI